MHARPSPLIYMFFALALACNIGFWFHARFLQARWANVPPVPGQTGVGAFALGDDEFAYRAIGLMLENIGNGGGESKPLKDYDYKRLGQWFFLADRLDPRSDLVPLLAAYYFGGTQNPSELPPLIDYLAAVGRRPEGEKWRWLAQAVFLARFREKDMNRALDLAQELAARWKPGRPLWLKEMPVLVMTAAGDKKTAYGLMLTIIREEEGKVQQAEINSTIVYICKRILDPGEAAVNPLCTANAGLMK